MLTRFDTLRPVGLASVVFPVADVFSTFLCAAGVHFFVSTNKAGVEAGDLCEDCNVAYWSHPHASWGTVASAPPSQLMSDIVTGGGYLLLCGKFLLRR